MIVDNREGARCSAFKANGEPCRAHATMQSELCNQHTRYPGPSKRKPKRAAGYSPVNIPELPDDDWEVKIRAYFSMMDPVEQADTMAVIFELINIWRIDSGLLPPPKGWVLCDPF